MRTRAAGLAAAAVVATALAIGLPRDARAGEVSRDDRIEEIDALVEIRSPSQAEQERLRAACADFVKRFPDDEEVAAVRQRLGLTLCALGRDEEAVPELAAVTATAKPGSKFRTFTRYSLGLALERVGEVERAREELAMVVAESPESEAAKASRADLRDLEKIGSVAPFRLEPGAKLPMALAFVWRGKARPADLPAAIREVSGWDDPLVRENAIPALPRVYVLDCGGRIVAAGVRGAAIQRALERAEKDKRGR